MEEDSRHRLLEIWRKLEPGQRHTLIQFAEFLAQQHQTRPAVVVEEPVVVPRPPGETAIQALKRLRKSYHMMEANATLLDDAAQLMTQRIFGASDLDIIPQMESLFDRHYRQWREKITPSS